MRNKEPMQCGLWIPDDQQRSATAGSLPEKALANHLVRIMGGLTILWTFRIHSTIQKDYSYVSSGIPLTEKLLWNVINLIRRR